MSFRNLPCLVIGAGGFIGANLCKRLLADGANVRALGRRGPNVAAAGAVEWLNGDFGDPAALAAAVRADETVFHLANSSTPESATSDIGADVRANVLPSLTLMDQCVKRGARRIIFISSGGTIYGKAQQTPTPESAPTDPINAYAIGKLSIEKYLALHEHLFGLSHRILRLANPYGPLQHARRGQGLVAITLSRALNGENISVWGDGSAIRDYIYIDDVVDALLATALDEGDERIFNIGAGKGESVRSVLTAVERALGAPLTIDFEKGRAIDLPISLLDISRAEAKLGWKPKISLQDGVARTAAWWRQDLSA